MFGVLPWGKAVPIAPPGRCCRCSVGEQSCLQTLILCVFVCSCWRRGLLDPRKVSVWRGNVWLVGDGSIPIPRCWSIPVQSGGNVPLPKAAICSRDCAWEATWEAQSWLGWPSAKVESFIPIFSSGLFEQHGERYPCVMRSGLAGRRENTAGALVAKITPPPCVFGFLFSMYSTQCFLEKRCFCKLLLKQSPGITSRCWGFFFASSGGACPPVGLCSRYSWGRGATAFPPHPQDFSCLQMLKWVFYWVVVQSHWRTWADGFSFKCLKQLKKSYRHDWFSIQGESDFFWYVSDLSWVVA